MSGAPTGGKLIRRRLRFERDYTQMPNRWLRDANTGWRAKGILGYLLSHDEGFEVSIKTLAGVGPDGYAAAQTAVRELEHAGYLERVQTRTKGGALDHVEWSILDPFDPVDNALMPKSQLSTGVHADMAGIHEKARSEPRGDFPSTGKPSTGKPCTENRRPIEDNLKNTSIGYLPEVSTEWDPASSQARYADAIAGRCAHDFDPTSGYCLRACGARDDETAAVS